MSQRFQMTRAAELESLSVFRGFISDCCTSSKVPDEAAFDLKLAVDEACTNIIEHGYKGMDPGSIILSLRVRTGPGAGPHHRLWSHLCACRRPKTERGSCTRRP